MKRGKSHAYINGFLPVCQCGKREWRYFQIACIYVLLCVFFLLLDMHLYLFPENIDHKWCFSYHLGTISSWTNGTLYTSEFHELWKYVFLFIFYSSGNQGSEISQIIPKVLKRKMLQNWKFNLSLLGLVSICIHFLKYNHT